MLFVKQTRKACLVAVLVGAYAVPSHGNATVLSGISEAYGESISLTATLLGSDTNLVSGPTPTATGTAPGAYNVTNSAASILVNVLGGLLGSLSTDALTATASSTVTGSPGAVTTIGSASVQNLSAHLLTVLGLSVTEIASSATITGDYGALVAVGTTTITGLVLNGLSLSDPLSPNYVLLEPSGVKVTLDEQFATGDGISSAGMIVNAIDVQFTDALANLGSSGLFSLNGQIIFGHSSASETATPDTIAAPEPGSAAILAGSLSMFGLLRARVAGGVRNWRKGQRA